MLDTYNEVVFGIYTIKFAEFEAAFVKFSTNSDVPSVLQFNMSGIILKYAQVQY